MIRELQERAARAQPADHTEYAAGWWLRHAPTSEWWIGTVLPHADGDVENRIAHAERFYERRGTRARFQITPGACPPQLDEMLAERGYRKESPVLTMTAATEEVLGRLSKSAGPLAAEAEASLPTAYARIGHEAIGRAVLDTGWVGVFGMATIPEARGTGKAQAVLAALAAWAGMQGADRMYLQVERDNAPARRLYEKAGFAEAYEYHYRTAAG